MNERTCADFFQQMLLICWRYPLVACCFVNGMFVKPTLRGNFHAIRTSPAAEDREMSHDDGHETEVRDRVRRIETRLTVLAKTLGVDVGGASVLWNGDAERVQVSTPNCSLAEILRAIPRHLQGDDADVYVGGQYLATVFTDAPRRSVMAQSSRTDGVNA